MPINYLWIFWRQVFRWVNDGRGMDEWSLEQVKSWDATSFDVESGGVVKLAKSGFSGVIDVDSSWLFMVDGEIVGPDEVLVDSLEGSGTAYSAPDPGLPLLFSMQGSEVQIDRGYTEEESFEAVRQRLSNDSFSGYLKLSEYVLSGDYYVVYHGEDTYPFAFVGGVERLHTGDGALTLANDEVGIFEVFQVDLRVTPIPEVVDASGVTSDSITPTD